MVSDPTLRTSLEAVSIRTLAEGSACCDWFSSDFMSRPLRAPSLLSDILTHGLPPLRFESAAIFRYRLSSRRTSWKPPVSRPFTDMLGMLIFIARLGLSRYEIWPVIDVCCPDIVVWEVTAAWNVLISLAFCDTLFTACSAASAALADFGSLPDALLPPP